MEKSDINDLTIVTLSYSRQDYAFRSMLFWSGRSTVVHVYDGSDMPISTEKLLMIGDNVYYHHLPGSLLARLGESLNYIDTEYVCLLCDDEFFIPSGLDLCIEYLKTHPDIVSCNGMTMGFSFQYPSFVMGFPQYVEHKDYAVLLDNPVQRMIYKMFPYRQSTMYSVVRANVWKKVVPLMVQKEFPFYAMGEIQYELAFAFHGKSIVLPHLVMLRSDENPQITETSIQVNPENRIWHWWRNSQALDQQNEFLDIMSKGLASTPAEVSVVRDGVSRAIDAYVNAYGGATPMSINTIINAIKRRIPPKIKRTIKKVLHRNPDSTATLMDAAKALAATGVTVDFQELENIERLITDFHKNRMLN